MEIALVKPKKSQEENTMIETKRQPYRVLTWSKGDCADVQDAVGRALKLIDKEMSRCIVAKDQKTIDQLVKERSTLHILLSAAIEI